MSNVDWCSVSSNCIHADIFYDILNDCIDQFVPLSCSGRAVYHHGIHYLSHIRKLKTKKRSCWRLYKKCRSPDFYMRYKHVSSLCRKFIFHFIEKREESLISTCNLGKFYRYANSELSSKTNVGPLRQANGSLTVDPQVKANLLSDHFGSAFAVDDGLRPIVSPVATLCLVLNLHQLYSHSQLSIEYFANSKPPQQEVLMASPNFSCLPIFSVICHSCLPLAIIFRYYFYASCLAYS